MEMKSVYALSMALIPLFVLTVPVYASATPSTMTFHNLTTTMVVTPIDCPDGSTIPGGELTSTGNGVIHLTADSNGGLHITGTQESSFVLVADSDVTFTGHFTGWFGGNAKITSTGATEFGSTFSAHGTGTDGSTISFHMDGHLTVTPDGTVTSAFMRLRC